jgi:uncharacterized protein (TIGR03546 family)
MNQLIQFINIMNSNTKPGELALGAVLGMFSAFLSPSPVDFLIVLFIALMLNCNLTFFFFCAVIFKALTFGIDPLGDAIGYAILNAPFFENIGNALMKMPVVPFTKFNFTVITGDLIIGLVLTPVVWFGTMKFVPYYREKWQQPVDKFMSKFKVVKALKVSSFYGKIKGE